MRHFSLAAFCLLLLAAPFVNAQESNEDARPAQISIPVVTDDAGQDEKVLADDAVPIDTGDNAWILVASALVLFMTAPGLAMFYGGLVRRKNILGVLMQCISLMGLMSIVWCLWGYSICFGGGGDGSLVGNFEFLLLENVQLGWNDGPNLTGAVVPIVMPTSSSSAAAAASAADG